jgi:hypothetical protein
VRVPFTDEYRAFLYASIPLTRERNGPLTPTPRWIPLFIGSIMMLMAALILGAVVGLVPTGAGQFLAPQSSSLAWVSAYFLEAYYCGYRTKRRCCCAEVSSHWLCCSWR